MLKRKKYLIQKKTFGKFIAVTVVLISVASLSIFSFKYVDNKIADKAQIQIEERLDKLSRQDSHTELEKMMLKNKITFSKSYIQQLTLENNISLLTEVGIHKETVDSTNYSNVFSESFTKKQMTVLDSYKALLSIKSTDLIYSVDDNTGDVHVSYNEDKIEILSVEIIGSTFFENNVFYRSYSKTEYDAIKKISINSIKEQFYNIENRQKANDNLIKFLITNAKQHGINKIYINDQLYNISFLET